MASASANTNPSLEIDAVPHIGRDSHRHPGSLSPSPTSTASSASILESDQGPSVASYWRSAERPSAQECLSQTTESGLASGPSSSSTLVFSSSSVSTSTFEEGQDTTKHCDAANCMSYYRVSSLSASNSLCAANDAATDPYADLDNFESLTLRDEIHPSSRSLIECNE